MPRVLIVHWDGGGNVPPQRALARELVRRGHEVHVASHDVLREAVEADGARFHRLRDVAENDAGKPHDSREQHDFFIEEVWASAAFARNAMAIRRAVRPDVFLVDGMLISTIQAAVRERIDFCLLDHLAWSPSSTAFSFLDTIARAGANGAEASSYAALRNEARLVLSTTFPAFGTETCEAKNTIFVGPIREAVTYEPWPRRHPQRPFVLVGLSSVHQEQEATLQAICTAMDALPVEGLVTTGRGIRPEMLRHGEHVDVRSFVPHDAVLPIADLVVTHGGLGTAMFSAAAGVPTLCFPNGRDQDDNVARIEAIGLGRGMDRNADATEIARAVSAMLRDSALKVRCRSFAAGVPRFGELARAADLLCAQAHPVG